MPDSISHLQDIKDLLQEGEDGAAFDHREFENRRQQREVEKQMQDFEKRDKARREVEEYEQGSGDEDNVEMDEKKLLPVSH